MPRHSQRLLGNVSLTLHPTGAQIIAKEAGKCNLLFRMVCAQLKIRVLK